MDIRVNKKSEFSAYSVVKKSAHSVVKKSAHSDVFCHILCKFAETIGFTTLLPCLPREAIIMPERQYIAIDLKSFYASVECVERGLDPLTTNLVVADKSRTASAVVPACSRWCNG